jgi:hypothetical protein
MIIETVGEFVQVLSKRHSGKCEQRAFNFMLLHGYRYLE